MVKYNIAVCRHDKSLVNVAAYVIPGQVCVVCLFVFVCVCVCGALVRSKQAHHTHLTRNYICGHIYQSFFIMTHCYILFYTFNNP
jgi:hypothetical protein